MEILEYDHRVITDACAVASRVAGKMATKGQCPVGTIRMLTGFFRTFVDDCHCLKEERVLFALLLKRRMSMFLGPITTLTNEHQKTRLLMNSVEKMLDGESLLTGTINTTIADLLNKYVALELEHLRKEDEQLYPMIPQMLTAAQLEPLTAEFLRIEQEALHGEPVEQYARRLRV